MKIVTTLLFAILLTGCARVQAVKEVVEVQIDTAADDFLESGLNKVCNLATVGSVRRAYQGDFAAWSAACPVYTTKVK